MSNNTQRINNLPAKTTVIPWDDGMATCGDALLETFGSGFFTESELDDLCENNITNIIKDKICTQFEGFLTAFSDSSALYIICAESPYEEKFCYWTIDDVLEKTPSLSKDDALQVMRYVERYADFDKGVRHDTITRAIVDLFGEDVLDIEQ